MIYRIPRVGLAVILIKNESVLLGKRRGSHGADKWAFPGGHLEYLESFEKCATREVEEETRLKVRLIDKNPSAVTNDYFKQDNKHYITLFLRAKYEGGNPVIAEPEKCSEWEWFNWNKLPSNLFVPVKNLIKQNYNPFK
jgi:8-oxo-dGTP diphosphatase